MKKKLEAELISIAHRILKLKNKSELIQLHQETQKLYEKLSVLKFVEENFGDVKPTIGYKEVEDKLEEAFEEKEEVVSEEASVHEEHEEVEETTVEETPEEVVSEIEKETVAEAEEIAAETHQEDPVAENEIEEEPAVFNEEVEEESIITEKEIEFTPLFEIAEEEDSVVEKHETKQITLEDLLGNVHPDPIFVRAEEVVTKETTTTNTNPETEDEVITKVEVTHSKKTEFTLDTPQAKPVSLNDMLSKSINIGLNDRIGFEKHLFGGSSEDLNRVLSQLSTFSNFEEANTFIEDMVKPDYNNWEGKDEYANRFMEIVEKKFS